MNNPPAVLELLALAWLRELTPADWTRLEALPELALALPDPDPPLVTELAAEHLRLLVLNVPPYETCFTDLAGRPPSQVSAAVADLFAHAGWVPPEGSGAVAADHVGLQLLALAHLARAGPARLAHLLTERLAQWMPLLAWSLRRIAPLPFYSALAEITLDAVLSRLGGPWGLGAHAAGESSVPPAGSSDPDPSLLLSLLLSPVTAGCYLSRAELARVAQSLCLPVTPGSRRDMLAGLARDAAARDCSKLLWDALENLLDDAMLDFTGLEREYPHWAPCRRIWSARLTHGLRLVQALRAAPSHSFA